MSTLFGTVSFSPCEKICFHYHVDELMLVFAKTYPKTELDISITRYIYHCENMVGHNVPEKTTQFLLFSGHVDFN